jgi:multisubunit Na+/H+ antiporter MnhC subunit
VNKRLSIWALLGLGLAILAAAAYVNYVNLAEAFGPGPPHFGRTTNMDKWANPIPFLLVIDAAAVAALVVLGALLRRLRRG